MSNTKSGCPFEHSTLPPGTDGVPDLDETIEFMMKPDTFLRDRQAQFGNTILSRVFGVPTVYMLGADGNEWVYRGENKYVASQWPIAFRRLLGETSIPMLTGAVHRERRRIVEPHFRFDHMAQFVPTIEAVAHKHLARWAEPDQVAIVDKMREFAFEVINVFLFSDDLAKIDLAYMSQEFVLWTRGLFAVDMDESPDAPFGRALRAKEILQDQIGTLVAERRASGEQKEDILGTYLTTQDSDGNLLTDAIIVDELQNLLFAGHDTTVTAMSNLMLHLSQNPAVLAKARAEQQAFDAKAPIRFDDLKAMPYLDAVIHESLRMVAPVRAMTRRVLENTQYQEYCIPKDYAVTVNCPVTHYDSEVWTEPEKFDPERWFDPRNEQKRKPFGFIAFGGGPRLCLGKNFALVEMRLMMALILRGYTWEVLPDQDLTHNAFPLPTIKSGLLANVSRI